MLVFLVLLQTLPVFGQNGILDLEENAENFEGLPDVIANLVSVDNTDPVIISDFNSKQQVIIEFLDYFGHYFVRNI